MLKNNKLVLFEHIVNLKIISKNFTLIFILKVIQKLYKTFFYLQLFRNFLFRSLKQTDLYKIYNKVLKTVVI